MNFIISIIIFVFLSIISFVLHGKFDAPDNYPFLIIGGILTGVSFIFFFTAIFQNMVLREMQKSDIAKIKTAQRKMEHKKTLMSNFKSEVQEFLTKLYPDYEKEMFKNMSPGDVEALQVYITKYPELKFNGILQSFTDKLTYMLKDVNESQMNIEDLYETIKIRNSNCWFLLRVEIPEEISAIFNK